MTDADLAELLDNQRRIERLVWAHAGLTAALGLLALAVKGVFYPRLGRLLRLVAAWLQANTAAVGSVARGVDRLEAKVPDPPPAG